MLIATNIVDINQETINFDRLVNVVTWVEILDRRNA